MRSANNRGTAKGGPPIAAPWMPDLASANGPARIETASGPAGRYRPWQTRRADCHVGVAAGEPVVRSDVERPHRDRPDAGPGSAAAAGLERLVTIIRRHGIRISDIDPHEQMLVLELRREFEPLVASRAARRATVDERRYLSKIADSFMEAGVTVDVMKFLRVHFESKRFVIACARNPFVANAFAPINALTRRFYFVYQPGPRTLPERRLCTQPCSRRSLPATRRAPPTPPRPWSNMPGAAAAPHHRAQCLKRLDASHGVQVREARDEEPRAGGFRAASAARQTISEI